MAYHIDADEINLDDLRKRIEATDLVPSRTPLLDELKSKLDTLKRYGANSLADLRSEMKTPVKVDSLARATGIDREYLVLLRREIESYFPKPIFLKAFDWLPREEIEKLESDGIKKTSHFFESFIDIKSRKDIKSLSKTKGEVFHQLSALCDLTRMQWTSPLAARMLLDAGYSSVRMVAKADPQALYDAFCKTNKGDKYFKGTIGLRDVKRLIQSASNLTT